MSDATNNNVGLRPDSDLEGDELAAFDALPPPLRRLLHDAVLDWCALELQLDLTERLERGVPPWLAVVLCIDEYRTAEREELGDFARNYEERFGHRLPHMAANATVQRYGRVAYDCPMFAQAPT